MSENKEYEAEIIRFRKGFRADRLKFIQEHGPLAFDQGRTLYRCRNTSQELVITDAFYGIETADSISALMEYLGGQWWRGRRQFKSEDDALDLEPIASVYAHFLPEVGYDYTVEYSAFDEPERPVRCWRVDAGGKATPLDTPQSEGFFLGQTGTFYNLHAGWRWLVERFHQQQDLQLEEIEPGYFVGARKGVPGDADPASRPDDDLQHAFSQKVQYGFDTLEFLGSKEALQYPFESGRYDEWLGPLSAGITAGEVDLFALVDSNQFVSAVEELCEMRDCTMSVRSEGDQLLAHLTMGQLALSVDLAFLLLRGIHTGRSFMSTAREFVAPTLDALEGAAELFDGLTERLSSYTTRIEEGVVLVVEEETQSIGRWNLISFVGRTSSVGHRQIDAVLRLMGFDTDGRPSNQVIDPRQCPVCGEPARVSKVVRPTAALGVAPATLIGVPVGDHTVYYTVECPQHATPLQQQPSLSLSDLEAAYIDGLPSARFTVVHQETLNESESDLIIGFDAGSLVLEPRRIRAILEKLKLDTTGKFVLYGLYPDALLVSRKPLDTALRKRALLRARERVESLFPGRIRRLDIARRAVFDQAPVGEMDWRQ
jgi:hypothetical protein